jgi:murein DD-endopeptidase MepM/ murein hydrolase activator NlpD
MVTTATAGAHLSSRRDRRAATRAVSRSAGRRHRPGVRRWPDPGGPGTARPPLPLDTGARTREVTPTPSRCRSSVRRGWDRSDAAPRSCPPRRCAIHRPARIRSGGASRNDAGAVDGNTSRAGRARPRRPATSARTGSAVALAVAALLPAVAEPGAPAAAAPSHLFVAAALSPPDPPVSAPPPPHPPRPGGSPGPPGTPLVPPAPPTGAGIPAPGARYAWPLLPVSAIAERFEAPPHPYGRGHRGVDLVGTVGRPVLAARAGTVVFAGPVGGRGVVSVHHDDGLRTTYEPVRPTVSAGAVVRSGDVIGLLEPGHAGCVPAVCLHWGVRRGRLEYLDPLVLLRPPEVRLLPVPDPWPAGIVPADGAPLWVARPPISRPRAPPACRAGDRPGGCAAGTPATR